MSAADDAPTRSYKALVRLIRVWLGVFFRRVEVVGVEHLPRSGGGVLVSWHPNGVVDPVLIMTTSPRPVIFGARDGLFRIPLFSSIVRGLGSVPIYRAQDSSEDPHARRRANEKSLDALAAAVAQGSFSALFPEGVSHDDPQLRSLKLGAARLFYRAHLRAEQEGTPAPVLVLVGLHYDRKSVFRSRALVEFFPPLQVPEHLAPARVNTLSDEAQKEAQIELTSLIERALTEVVGATESWELRGLMARARSLIRAERGARYGARHNPAELSEERRGFARVWVAYRERVKSRPEETQRWIRRLSEYDARMRTIGLRDRELDHPPRLWLSWGPILIAAQLACLYFLLPPVLFFGFAVNAPPYFALKYVVQLLAKDNKDQASLKILLGAVLFLTTWIGVAALVTWGLIDLRGVFPGIPHAPFALALSVFLFCALGGAMAMQHQRVMKETMNALKVRWKRKRRKLELAELKLERAALHDGLTKMAEGVSLPHEIDEQGLIVAAATKST